MILELCQEISREETQSQMRLWDFLWCGSFVNVAYFVAKEGLSFRKYPQLSELQCKSNIGPGKNHFAGVTCQSFILTIRKTDLVKLAVLNSIRLDPYLEDFDDGISKIFKFYFYSPIW